MFDQPFSQYKMSPRTKEQFEIIRQQSKESIQEAALELFARNGFHNTSISQIAKLARVSKGLIYNYFESKDALLETIIEQAIDTGEEFFEGYLTKMTNPMDKLKHLIEGIFAQIKASPKYFKLLLALSMQEDIVSRFESTIQSHSNKNLGQLIELFSEINIPNPKMESMHFAALLDGVVLHFLSMGNLYPLDEMKEFIIEKIVTIVK